MDFTRRGFIKGVLGGVLGLAVLPALLKAPGLYLRRASAAPTIDLADGGGGERHWGFVVDASRCIGCGLCVQACKRENNVVMEPEYNRTWVERYVYTEEGEVFVDSPEAGIEGFANAPANLKYAGLDIDKSHFVPKLCNQCENPPCVQVCPVGATYKTEDGVVLVDQEHCIGCRYCIQACPYGARYLVPSGGVTPMGYSKVVDKCTWCYHRITKGLRPACVEVCPVGARLFGDLHDPESPVAVALRDHPPAVLKPALGTKPRVYYLGIDTEVR
ncbi:MAG: 4Fe-4S ferredoxin [Dehalococcoidia bacterium]|nr:4Fe-4S ferredoxin [Dehalococcoidia bacterium]